MLIKFYGCESLDNLRGLSKNRTEKAFPKEGHLFVVH